MDKFYIDMPSDFEIENQINNIIEYSIKEKESFYSHLKNMYKSIGFKYIFHDISELTFVGMLMLGIILLVTKNIMRQSDLGVENLYAFIFMTSPLIYFANAVFSYINIKENNTYQVEMVCKYNTFQVAALRMLVFSIVCILANTVIIMIIADRIVFLKGIMISISSLFLFSTLVLYSLLNIKNIITKYFVVFGWIGFNGVLYIIDLNIYNQILLNIPTYIYCIVSVGAVFLYIKNIKKLSGYKNLNLEM